MFVFISIETKFRNADRQRGREREKCLTIFTVPPQEEILLKPLPQQMGALFAVCFIIPSPVLFCMRYSFVHQVSAEGEEG